MWDFGKILEIRVNCGWKQRRLLSENAIDGLGVYPNPFSTIATVNFNNNTGIDAIIEVVNMVGQVVYTENAGDASGLQNVTIDGTSFDAGIYMINVKAGRSINIRKSCSYQIRINLIHIKGASVYEAPFYFPTLSSTKQ